MQKSRCRSTFDIGKHSREAEGVWYGHGHMLTCQYADVMPDELLFRLRDVQALKRPSERNQGSLYQEVKRSIVDAENEWILQSDDLAAVAQDAEHGWFNVALESFLNSLSRKALFVSRTSLPFENLFGMTIK